MKKITKTRQRQIISTVLGIMCVSIILCAAFAFPKYYCRFNDLKTLNKLNYTDISVNTYETAYSSFPEKIHALARVTTAKNSLQAVQINEPGMETSTQELTDIVNAEIAKLYDTYIIPKKIKLSEKKNSLSQRYTIYEANKNSNFKGISCWKLVYTSKTRTVTIYLDEEYHKIYYIKIQKKKASADNVFIIRSRTSIDKPMEKPIAKTTYTDGLSGYQQESYTWWDGMLQYFDLLLYKDAQGQQLDGINLYGIVDFIDNCQISITESYYDTNEDNKYNFTWASGIELEEMIQF